MTFFFHFNYNIEKFPKASIVESIDEYVYSSYNEYIEGESTLIDMGFVYSMLSKESFIEFNNKANNDICLDIDEQKFRLSDNDARKIIRKVSKCESATEFQALDQNERDKYIHKLKSKGLSYRQISRLTGISFAIVRKA